MVALILVAMGLAGLVAVGVVVKFVLPRQGQSENTVRLPALDEDIPVVSTVPQVEVESLHDDYAIVGFAAADLRRDMNAKGPREGSDHYDANTRWYVQWSYPRQVSAASCATGPIHVTVTITYRMPEWDPPSAADPGLVQKWRVYESHLMTHEKGHAKNGVAAGEEIFHDLQAVSARGNCGELDSVVNAQALAVLEKYKHLDVDYDKNTQHGVTQGARFP